MEDNMLDWETRYCAGDTPWDKGAPAPALEEVHKGGGFPEGATILVPGCGYGRDVVWLAKKACRVIGLDVSAEAVRGAQERAGKSEVVKGAEFVIGNLFDEGWTGGRRFDVIWEHTCFCAISPKQRDAYVEAVYRLLKPGGVLVGLFFAFGDDQDGPPFKADVETLHRYFKKCFTLEWERRPERFFPTREGQELLMCWKKEG